MGRGGRGQAGQKERTISLPLTARCRPLSLPSPTRVPFILLPPHAHRHTCARARLLPVTPRTTHRALPARRATCGHDDSWQQWAESLSGSVSWLTPYRSCQRIRRVPLPAYCAARACNITRSHTTAACAVSRSTTCRRVLHGFAAPAAPYHVRTLSTFAHCAPLPYRQHLHARDSALARRGGRR